MAEKTKASEFASKLAEIAELDGTLRQLKHGDNAESKYFFVLPLPRNRSLVLYGSPNPTTLPYMRGAAVVGKPSWEVIREKVSKGYRQLGDTSLKECISCIGLGPESIAKKLMEHASGFSADRADELIRSFMKHVAKQQTSRIDDLIAAEDFMSTADDVVV
jgi:hypothetical protein